MPPVAVYLVKFFSRASIAARLMFAGVGKSGSPAPKSTRLTPLDLSRSAFITTAAVGETEIREILSESCIILPSLFSLFLPQPLGDDRRHQVGDRTAVPENLAHQPRADIRVGLGRHQENRLQARLQFPVRQRHLQLVLVIGKR